MKNNLNYVPVLKWKRAEMGALEELTEAERNKVTPLIELVMPKPKSKTTEKDYDGLYAEVIEIFRTKRVLEIPNEIATYWGKNPIFVDFTLLYPADLKLEAMNYIIKTSSTMGLNIIPVVNFSDSQEYKAAAIKSRKEYGHDLCLRVSTFDLSNVSLLNEKIDKYLALEQSGTANTYILVDIKDDNTDNYNSHVAASQRINKLEEWKGFIFASGSFPVDLSNCKKDEDNYIARVDWLNWNKFNKREGLLRIPTFSDYGIRHPIYNASFQFLEATASIKYTRKDDWYVIKGEKRKYEYFLAGASLLVTHDFYDGEDFSYGDRYIAEKAAHYPKYMKNRNLKGTGTTELWLKAGLNHHLSVVLGQLSS